MQGKGHGGGAMVSSSTLSASNSSGGGTSKLDMFANLAASSEQPSSSMMVPYQGNHPIPDDFMTMSMGFNFSNMSSDPFTAQYASQYFGNFDNHQTAYLTPHSSSSSTNFTFVVNMHHNMYPITKIIFTFHKSLRPITATTVRLVRTAMHILVPNNQVRPPNLSRNKSPRRRLQRHTFNLSI
jgi:hypothetical protein